MQYDLCCCNANEIIVIYPSQLKLGANSHSLKEISKSPLKLGANSHSHNKISNIRQELNTNQSHIHDFLSESETPDDRQRKSRNALALWGEHME